ncbi:hypothetical protein STCU_10948 [Strigomonas culicis]|uniref:Uncharacterized protein n=1 Tax=Strigomonas culicis TaxID=28005 RepID=S9TIZ7_9TRYP|nr:hypothetical protein STCU_10948 [Strigomonas culicis]|eukprot:EPY16854.1 hypothetical protein STCU_10948 [Strigomonas culicis]
MAGARRRVGQPRAAAREAHRLVHRARGAGGGQPLQLMLDLTRLNRHELLLCVGLRRLHREVPHRLEVARPLRHRAVVERLGGRVEEAQLAQPHRLAIERVRLQRVGEGRSTLLVFVDELL